MGTFITILRRTVSTPTPLPIKNTSKTKVGWTVGGGVEHMLTQNWTLGLEALFVDLGSNTANFNFDGTQKAAKFSNQAVIGRVKLNYKW